MLSINLAAEFKSDPHFPMLYDTWSEILRPNRDGSYDITAADAVSMLMEARRAVQDTGLYSEQTTTKIESRALRLACLIPIEIEDELGDPL